MLPAKLTVWRKVGKKHYEKILVPSDTGYISIHDP